MEGATCHPLQTFADLITIEEYKNSPPESGAHVAPHQRLQAVPNSFADFMNEADVDFIITHPEGYELGENCTQCARGIRSK